MPLHDGGELRLQVVPVGVGVDVEVAVAGQHGGEGGFGRPVEDVAGYLEAFGIGEFVADAERWAGAFGDDEVGCPEPGGVLFVDGLVFLTLFVDVEAKVADVFGEYAILLLQESDDLLVECRILAAAADGAGEVDVFGQRDSSFGRFSWKRDDR